MKDHHTKYLASLATVFLLLCATPALAGINASYLYTFSNFTGKIPLTWPALSADREHGEIYVITRGGVSVFNSVGMEIYRFGDDQSLGLIADVAVEPDGKILVLASDVKGPGTYAMTRCNFRGEPQQTVELTGLPKEFSEFHPGRIVYRNGYLYLVDGMARKIVVTDPNGAFVDGYDVGEILKKEEKPNDENHIVGFNVDKDGNMLFTVPTLFTAYRLSRDHRVESFGGAGNIDGKFNVVGGIASDDRGFIYVADLLKSVVMVYDNQFRFQMQFGHRGEERGALFTPQQVEVLSDKIFVNQARNKGVSVFRMAYD